MLGALTTPRHTILATVLAIGVALPVVYATEVTADSKVAITDVERKITAIDKVIKRHTYELRDATARVPSDATRSVYRLTAFKEQLLCSSARGVTNIRTAAHDISSTSASTTRG